MPEITAFTKDGKQAKNPLNTNEGKEQLNNFIELNKDKLIIKESDFDSFKFMKNTIINHPKYFEYYYCENYEIEKEIYFEYRGIDCRAKLDKINYDLGLIIDLKTINNINRSANSVKYDYNRQAAFYKLAMQSLGYDFDFMFVFSEKTYPNFNKFIGCSEMTIESGKFEYNRLIDKFLNYLDNPDCYKGYNDSIIIV
jgi:hypothetical protein